MLAGARLVRDVPADHMLSYDDVELDEDSLIVKMRRYQEALARGEAVPSLTDLQAAIAG